MGFLDNLKIRTALLKHQKGEKAEAKKIYEELYTSGVLSAAYMLPYSVLLLREGEFEKVKEILLKAQKARDLTDDKRPQLLMNYSVAAWKLGDKEKAIDTLEAAHRKYPCGILYQTLGYLYVELGDKDKALQFNREALEYDDEDAIVLDNMGQTYYRLLQDKAGARPQFEKANRLNPGQIDTLYFLSRYDIEEGKVSEAAEKLEEALKGNFSPLNYCTRTLIEEELQKLRGTK